MNQPIEDRAAIVFAQGFYDGLGYENVDNHDVIQRAFDEGIVAIELEIENLLQGAIPHLWKLGIATGEIEPIRELEQRSSNRNSEISTPTPGSSTDDNSSVRAPDYRPPEIVQSPLPDDLSSDRAIDYTRLRDLLVAGQWKDADYETYLVMLRVLGRKEGDWIRDDELLNFPCTDLRTIDSLWVKYSAGRFGFSVQKKIYLEVGGKPDGQYDEEAFAKFGDRVGWRVKYCWQDYEQNIFDTTAPRGHLPCLFHAFASGISRIESAFLLFLDTTL